MGFAVAAHDRSAHAPVFRIEEYCDARIVRVIQYKLPAVVRASVVDHKNFCDLRTNSFDNLQDMLRDPITGNHHGNTNIGERRARHRETPVAWK